MKRYVEALEYFEYAIQKNPDDSIYYFNKGMKELYIYRKNLKLNEKK